MIEILIFLIAAISGLFIAGFAVHMFIGGLVSIETENQITFAVCTVIGCIIIYMIWDVFQRRRSKKP